MKAEEEAAAQAAGPEKYITKLHEELGQRQTAIEIEGHTSDLPRLHAYVAELSHSPLIAGASPKSLESYGANQTARTRFTLRLMVRPGYCQRGGDAAQTPTNNPSDRTSTGGGGR